MDGQQPPPGYYDRNNWTADCQQVNEDDLVYGDEILTNSQAQYLNTLIAEGNTNDNFVTVQHGVTVDEGSLFVSHMTTSSFNDFHQQQPPIMCSNLLPSNDLTYLSNPDPLLHEEETLVAIHPGSFTTCNEVTPAIDSIWAGALNFAVEISKAQDRTKATPWIHSSRLNKLFVSLDKACPINFKMDIPPQEFLKYYIRGQVVYSQPEHFNDYVERCLNHQGKDQPQPPNVAHVLRCDDTNSNYVNHEDKRHSVLVPLKQPSPGMQSVTLCFRFMCLSSCQGSLNRRPTKLIFTLENALGEEVGRYACDVRICSCPGRDIRNEEEKIDKNSSDDINGTNTANNVRIELPSVDSKGKTKKRKATTHSLPPPPSVPNPSSEDNNEIFNLNINVNIRGRREFELARDLINRILENYEYPPRNSNGGQQPADHNDTSGKRFKKEQR